MKTRELGRTGQPVSALGRGCVSMASDYAYGPSDEREAVVPLHRALDLDVTLWDPADVYGFDANEEPLRHVLVPNRSRVFLTTKFGFVADGTSAAAGTAGGAPGGGSALRRKRPQAGEPLAFARGPSR